MNKLIIKIIKDCIIVLIIASIISSMGGIGIELIQEKIFSILPLIIIFPALSDMVGDFGCIISSKFTTMLYLGNVEIKDIWKSESIKKLYKLMFKVSLISAVYLTMLAIIMTLEFDLIIMIKILLMTALLTLVITGVIFLVSIAGGLYIHKRNQDPDNYLIPITTSIGDLTTLLMLATMTTLFF